ncbi:HopJ type III effector protein [Vibrio sp.]|uniref:HopJ type III effector protein n=1 Tax=Vibrio sp. TaxID=678 RepID=UPI003D0EF20C
MDLQAFILLANTHPEQVEFETTIEVIEANYQFTPTAFTNGEVNNAAGQNNGSCKIFAFAKLHQLSEQATLHCFGHYYRQDVLLNPAGDDHLNIRNFIKTGWEGVTFSSQPLVEKQ